MLAPRLLIESVCCSQHPVTWQPSKEGDHLIGRITLSKRSAMPKEAGAPLGLKVRAHTRHNHTVARLFLCVCVYMTMCVCVYVRMSFLRWLGEGSQRRADWEPSSL